MLTPLHKFDPVSITYNLQEQWTNKFRGPFLSFQVFKMIHVYKQQNKVSRWLTALPLLLMREKIYQVIIDVVAKIDKYLPAYCHACQT